MVSDVSTWLVALNRLEARIDPSMLADSAPKGETADYSWKQATGACRRNVCSTDSTSCTKYVVSATQQFD